MFVVVVRWFRKRVKNKCWWNAFRFEDDDAKNSTTNSLSLYGVCETLTSDSRLGHGHDSRWRWCVSCDWSIATIIARAKETGNDQPNDNWTLQLFKLNFKIVLCNGAMAMEKYPQFVEALFALDEPSTRLVCAWSSSTKLVVNVVWVVRIWNSVSLNLLKIYISHSNWNFCVWVRRPFHFVAMHHTQSFILLHVVFVLRLSPFLLPWLRSSANALQFFVSHSYPTVFYVFSLFMSHGMRWVLLSIVLLFQMAQNTIERIAEYLYDTHTHTYTTTTTQTKGEMKNFEPFQKIYWNDDASTDREKSRGWNF